MEDQNYKDLIREVDFGVDQEGAPPPTIDFSAEYMKKLFETGGFAVYLNQKTQEILVKIQEYHAGTLVIKKQGLEKLLHE